MLLSVGHVSNDCLPGYTWTLNASDINACYVLYCYVVSLSLSINTDYTNRKINSRLTRDVQLFVIEKSITFSSRLQSYVKNEVRCSCSVHTVPIH